MPRQLAAAFEADLGRKPDAADRNLIRRTSLAAELAEQMLTRALAGEAIALDDVARLENIYRNGLNVLGLRSAALEEDGGPSLADYLAAKAAQQPAGESIEAAPSVGAEPTNLTTDALCDEAGAP